MNILFMSLLDFNTFEERNIYTDLLRELIKNGHKVYCVSPIEKRQNKKTHIITETGGIILKQRIGNIQKCNVIEKGISTLLIERQCISGIKKHFSNVKFDLVLYATPPITIENVIRYVKKCDGARTYLMLKDIFPQNSVDLGMLKISGIKGLIYKYFRKKEKKLYAISDRIGCMSLANCEYLLSHNLDVSPDKVEVFPNCIEPIDMRVSDEEKTELRKKYNLPLDKKIFVYGGNLGKPQDVPFIIECLKASMVIGQAHFVIAGSGTDRHFLEDYVHEDEPTHVTLLGYLPKDEYDRMIACCDVGLIFLDHRFTIPNFPSRLLVYMQAGLPVLACTDPYTDIGRVITDGGFGWWCQSDDVNKFLQCFRQVCMMDTQEAGALSWQCLNRQYPVQEHWKLLVE